MKIKCRFSPKEAYMNVGGVFWFRAIL
ncbi:hypothetical protein PENNAL_c0983G01856, partial [Penicillium nalgiovense]